MIRPFRVGVKAIEIVQVLLAAMLVPRVFVWV